MHPWFNFAIILIHAFLIFSFFSHKFVESTRWLVILKMLLCLTSVNKQKYKGIQVKTDTNFTTSEYRVPFGLIVYTLYILKWDFFPSFFYP